MPSSIPTKARRVKLLALDVDGVLTDGGLYYGPAGEALKRFDVKDGLGIVLCREAGLPAAILTARSSPIVAERARDLGFAHVLQGRADKAAGFEELLAAAGLEDADVAYVGDDVNDLPVLRRVGLSACPADAVAEVRRAVDHRCRAPGGHGAVREVCELILRAKGLWRGSRRPGPR
ncbi:MAG: HAD hydrolase family protein [Deltaproteobacteria bacterium]|nr:HAD hydrolase family protein [Deltaproteobacteria bacterium]